MRITASQLRRIIKEEVSKVLRETDEMESDAGIEIPNVSEHADAAGMSLKRFIKFVERMGAEYPSIVFEAPNALDADSYSAEYDSLHATGSRADLEAFARKLDKKLMGAQSMSAEDSFVNAIYDL